MVSVPIVSTVAPRFGSYQSLLNWLYAAHTALKSKNKDLGGPSSAICLYP